MKRTIFTAFAGAFLLSPVVPSAFALDDHNPIGVSGAFEGVITTGCAYNVLNHNARRGPIEDIVVPGAIGKYGLKMVRYYNSRRTSSYLLMGPGWSYEYFWTSGNDRVEYPDGNVWDKSCDIYGNAPLGVSDWPTTLNGHPAFRLADGGTVVFENPNWGVATKIIDPYGQVTTITINSSNGLITQVTEPGGRYLKFFYQDPDVATLLTKVEAHGLGNATITDSVVYHYTAIRPAGGGSQGNPMKCLTSVDYSDGQHAYYTYEDDNVPEYPQRGSSKIFPLVSTCNDVRYHGPMRRIGYDYQDQGPHGAILKERYSPSNGVKGVMVSKIEPAAPSPIVETADFDTTYTETRGDGNGNITRTFTYSELHLIRHHGEPESCPDGFRGPAPQQFLLSYTDFQGHTTTLDYDRGVNNDKWYVNSVIDANGHTTRYTRGPRPPAGIGEITQIEHPDHTTINYAYTDNGHYLTQITDERGNITYHARDASHRITRTDHKDSQGNIIAYEEFQYAHNNFGLLSTHHLPSNTGWSGPYEHFQYDNRGLLVAKTNPTTIADWTTALNQAPKTTYSYYNSGAWTDQVETMTLPRNGSGNAASETYEYDLSTNNTTRGLITKITHADGKYQSFGYDVYGNKLWEENELRKRTSYTYDDYNRVLTVKDPIGQATGRKTTYTYNPTIGTGSSFTHTTNNPDTITTPAGIQTSNVYDENFRKTSTKVGTSTTSFGYDNVGNPTTVTDPLLHTTTTDYDTRNRKWHVTDALNHRTTFGYDPAGNVNSITRPDNRIETKAYDAMNRLIRHTVPKTATISLTTTFGYWPSGKLFWVKDPKQQGTQLATYLGYNESDLMNLMYYPGLTEYQQWTYDDAHNLVSRRTVHGETQSFTYDIRNRKTGMNWDNISDSASFTYWDDSKLKTAQNANSTVYREYDDAGRLELDRQTVNGVGAPVDVNHAYDDDGKEKHLWVPGASYDYTFDYDSMGRFQFIFPTGNSNALFQYSYDAASNEIQRFNWPNGVAQIYNRDHLNRIWRLDVKKGATLLGREDYGYDAMNRLVSTTREDNRQDQFWYYLDGELSATTYGANPTPTPSPPSSPTPTPPGGQVAEPGFNPAGHNVYPATGATVTISTATAGASIRYTLDGGAHWTTIANNASVTFQVGTGKILTAIGFKAGMADSDPHSEEYWRENPGGTPISPETLRTVTYYYDGAGNRTGVADTLLGNAVYTPNDLNQYDTVTASTIINGNEHEIWQYQGPYDAALATYTYINDEHLKSATVGSNSYYLYYDALGRCVKRTLNGVTTAYIYDGEKPILEYSGTNVGRNVYGKGIDEILMRSETGINGNQPFYFQQDHEGSVTHLTNAAGNIIERYRYDTFGGPFIYAPNWTGRSASLYKNRFLFTGREYAGNFAFYEYRARAYHPGLGRFMSEDPKLFDAGDYNLFRYCHNDPEDLTDPMGTTDMALDPGPTHANQAREMDRGNAQWAMAKWADSSNNFQGTFTQFSAGHSLTMGQVGQGMRVERAIPIRGQRDPLLDRRTENSLVSLAEPVQKMARSLLYHARADLGLDVRIIQGTRTYAEQNALYAQGRTTSGPIVTNAPGGYSFHNFGVAFDVGLFRGRAYIEGGSGYTNVGHLGEGIGLEWGGRWHSFQDIPHFQYPGLSLNVVRARVEQGLSPIPGY